MVYMLYIINKIELVVVLIENAFCFSIFLNSRKDLEKVID